MRKRSIFFLNHETVGFFAYFAKAYPHRTALMVALLLLAGFAEGVGIVTFLPLLEVAANDGTVNSGLGRRIVDLLSAVGLETTLATLLSFIVVAITARALFLWAAMNQAGYTVAHVSARLRLALIELLLSARWRYFSGRKAGELANTINFESMRAATSYREACAFLASVIEAVIYAVIALLISVPVTIFAIAAGALLALALRRFVDMSRDAGEEQTRVYKNLSAQLVDGLGGIKAIRAMAKERHLLPLLSRDSEAINRAQRRAVLAVETRTFLQEPIVGVMLALGLYGMLTYGSQSLPSILVVAFLFHRLLGRVQTLQQRYQGIVGGESAFWSLKAEMDAAGAEQETEKGRVDPPLLEDRVEFRGVSFSYGDTAVLDNISLSIPAGKFVAIVGPSGAGKTTIADLILGLHEPDSGEVLVDGVPLGQVSLRKWRELCGYVPQETLLFHDTILRNVTLGDESIPREDVERALRAAGAWNFVTERPLGMDAVIGERGGKLSGGQRQRIAIARALVGRPRLLILDEATTALDPGTEAAICETLKGLAGKVTIVAISHQTAMRDTADIIYHLEGGQITPAPISPTALPA